MYTTIALRKGLPFSLMIIALLALGGALWIYYQSWLLKTAADPLVHHLAGRTGIEAPEPVFQEAVRLAAGHYECQ